MAYGFLNTVAALNILRTKLQALPMPGSTADATGVTADSTAQDASAGLAFQRVEFFDLTSILDALKEMVIYANRICLIVHDVERFENEKKGQQLHTRQYREVVLLIADKHMGSRQKALIGDSTTPGVLALKDAVLNNIVGLLGPGLYCEPMSGEQMVIEQKVREQLQGRVAFSLTIRIVGGNVITSLGMQPIP